VIASNIGGTPELVEDGVTGWLFEPGNAADLAEKMARFIDRPDRIGEMGEAGLGRISALALPNQARLIAAVYESPARKTVPSSDSFFIACAGNRFNADISEAIESLPRYGPAARRTVMADWLDENDLRSASLIWVTDPALSAANVQPLLRSHAPLLVAESNEELRNLCRDFQCGLFYRDAREAVACIDYLAANPAIAKAMGKNGFRAFYHLQSLRGRTERSVGLPIIPVH